MLYYTSISELVIQEKVKGMEQNGMGWIRMEWDDNRDIQYNIGLEHCITNHYWQMRIGCIGHEQYFPCLLSHFLVILQSFLDNFSVSSWWFLSFFQGWAICPYFHSDSLKSQFMSKWDVFSSKLWRRLGTVGSLLALKLI